MSHVHPISVRLPEPLKAWLIERAKADDRSINSQLIRIIKAAKSAEDSEAA